MQRNQFNFLKTWLGSKNREPLIIRGARQVGKSTLVELFSEQAGLGLLNVNLERFPALAEVFGAKDPEQILAQIEFLPRMPAVNDQSILFLDEIQAVPEAIPALRYFYEDRPELPVLSAGSLLEFALNDHRFSMPVGRVQYLHMGPMTFGEYLLSVASNTIFALFEYNNDKVIMSFELNKLLAFIDIILGGNKKVYEY